MHTDKPLYIDLLITGRNLAEQLVNRCYLVLTGKVLPGTTSAIIESGLATRLLAEKKPDASCRHHDADDTAD